MYGLIGEKLGHSYSKIIHEKLADYEYNLFPLTKAEFKDFMTKKDFTAINVTIPYKESVIPYLDELESEAKRIGAVNTIYRYEGKLIGANTDYYGFKYLLEYNNIDVKDKRVLILGNGGAAKAVIAVIKDLDAREIKVVSILNEANTITYEEAYSISNDIDIIINTSPLGMYPNIDESPIDLSDFNNLNAVVDVVYNPLETKIYKDAKAKGIVAATGLIMLIAQAKEAVELFTDKKVDDIKIEEIYKELLKNFE